MTSTAALQRDLVDHALKQQDNCLEAWEAQQRQWASFQRKMAKKLHKSENELLVSTVWKHRVKQEEVDMIDASVPQSVRGGDHAWEMGLRGGASGAGGVRYVRAGSTYPYPLYCPVKDRDHLPSDHNTFMRVLTHEGFQEQQRMNETQQKNRSVTETQYYKEKEKQYKTFIEKKFPHRMHGQAVPLVVYGQPVPVSDTPVDPRTADEFPEEGVSWTNAPERPQSAQSAATTEKEQTDLVSPTSAATEQQEEPIDEGPRLLFESERLNFTTEPNTLAQASLLVKNPSSVAIFYSWKRLQPTDNIVLKVNNQRKEKEKDGKTSNKKNKASTTTTTTTHLPTNCNDDDTNADKFVLSDALSGVLLPEEERYFTFGFQTSLVGIYIEDWALETVPKDTIKLRLRGVVQFRDEDPMSRTALINNINHAIATASAREIFTRMLNYESQTNTIDVAERDLQTANALAQAQAEIQAEEQQATWQQEQFLHHNSHLGVHYWSSVYDTFDKLYTNIHHYLYVTNSTLPQYQYSSSAAAKRNSQQQSTPTGVTPQPQGADQTPEPQDGTAGETPPLTQCQQQQPPKPLVIKRKGLLQLDGVLPEELDLPKWDASLQSLLELITQVTDPEVQSNLMRLEAQLRRTAKTCRPELEEITLDEFIEMDVQRSAVKTPEPVDNKDEKKPDKKGSKGEKEKEKEKETNNKLTVKDNTQDRPGSSGSAAVMSEEDGRAVTPPKALTPEEVKAAKRLQKEQLLFEIHFPTIQHHTTVNSLLAHDILNHNLNIAVSTLTERAHMLQLSFGMIDEPLGDATAGNKASGKQQASAGKDRKVKKEDPKKRAVIKGQQGVKRVGLRGTAGPGSEEIDEDELRQRVEQEYHERLEVEARTVVLDCLDHFLAQLGASEARMDCLVNTSLCVSYRERILKQEEQNRIKALQGDDQPPEEETILALKEKEEEKAASSKNKGGAKRK
eukprot:TRINITY_DN64325_c0_g1_i1.p1 TRINITY_DN64325_c0_g1~~TRINITY_DN64325_c0_g1_i1.p1  ORF type:complete len:958 (+),score=133.06 TRINITY_DN64325_c0_g1_i1:134-3007(+)